jgi:myo-inositol-1(or 4)-monophosphatase
MNEACKPVITEESLQQRLHVAKLACMVAGNMHRESYQTNVSVMTKSSGIDLVTRVDQECDEAISAVIRSLCPHDRLLTEESFEDADQIKLDCTWVVDPLDGTTNYAHGFPYFAVSIAFVVDGVPQVATVYDAMHNEMFSAIRGQGAFLNDRPISVSATTDLSQSLLATGFPYDTHIKPEDNMAYFMKFMATCHGVRRAGAAALDLAYTAAGRLDGFWELRLAPWDVLAGALIIEEAGGQVSDFFGEGLNFAQRKINIVGSNGSPIHQQIVDICKDSPVAAQAVG